MLVATSTWGTSALVWPAPLQKCAANLSLQTINNRLDDPSELSIPKTIIVSDIQTWPAIGTRSPRREFNRGLVESKYLTGDISVRPTNYKLSLHSLELGGSWTYQGTLRIALKVNQSAKEIVLNAYQLKLHSAELLTDLNKTEESAKAVDITEDKDRQRVTLTFEKEFSQSEKAYLDIKFEGVMNNVGRPKFSILTTANNPAAHGWLLSLSICASSGGRKVCSP